MKKQLLSLITLCMVTIGYSQSVGDTFFSNSITYQITSLSPNEVETYGYVVSGGPVVNVPASVMDGGNTYSVTSIGNNTFASKGLTSVTLPNTIINIGQVAFTDNSLTSISIPNSVTTIGYAAFGVNAITSVIIPDSVISLGDNAFDTNALTSVAISNGLTTIGSAVFNNNSLTSVTIPDNIISIGNSAFNNNQLTSVTIPANVNSIGGASFNNNPLTSVTALNVTPPTITTNGSVTDTFAANRSSIDLIIPVGTTGPYVTDPGALWTGFNSVTEGTLSVSNFELEHDIKVITEEEIIKITASKSINLTSYDIYNISGQIVVTGKEREIPTNTFTSGIYILKLDFDKGTIIKKVLVY